VMARTDHDFAAELAARLAGRVELDASLGGLTTYRVGGRVSALVRAGTVGDLRVVGEVLRGRGVAVLVVGRGSNLLVADEGFVGVAVTLEGEFETIQIHDDTVTAGGDGVVMDLDRLELPFERDRDAHEPFIGHEQIRPPPDDEDGHAASAQHFADHAQITNRARPHECRDPSSDAIGRELTQRRVQLDAPGQARRKLGREVMIGARHHAPPILTANSSANSSARVVRSPAPRVRSRSPGLTYSATRAASSARCGKYATAWSGWASRTARR